jgi:hypothetical protein
MPRTACLVLAVALLAGCGAVRTAADKKKAENALKALTIEYFEFQAVNGGRPPASADELDRFVRSRGGEANLQPGELETLTVRWGARLDVKSADAGGSVLATGRAVGDQVAVMMQDGSVRWMTVVEASLAPKAAEPAPPPRPPGVE